MYALRGLGASALASAIFRQEGSTDASGNWNTSSLGYRNNNPGNLNYAGQPNCWATTTGNGSEAACATLADGIQATENQLNKDAGRGLTIAQEFTKWATGNQAAYIADVSQWTGYDPSTPLSQDLSGAPAVNLPTPDTTAPDTTTTTPDTAAGTGLDLSSLLDTSSTVDLSSMTGGLVGQVSTVALAAMGVAAVAILWLGVK